MTETIPELDALCSRIHELIGPYAGRVEYGNLRMNVDRWEAITNLALVYETPGGSTDQINISFSHSTRTYALVNIEEGEVTTASVEDVIETIRPRVVGIPEKRREHLYAEIRRQVDSGSNTAGVVGHLNRMMNSGFKGGTMTHLEMRDAMTYAVKYMKAGGNQPTPSGA